MSSAILHNRKKQSPNSMSKVNLPEDVIHNVLARLPVKTLLKFRCVSKSWTDLIDSPNFIKSHLNLSLTDSKSDQKFIVGYEHRKRFNLFPGNLKSLHNSHFLDSPGQIYCPEPIYDEEDVKLVGTSRGLVCIRYGDEGICLSNPWTRKYKILPCSPLEIIPEERYGVNTRCYYGFGYDDIHDDYKVVRLNAIESEQYLGIWDELVEIYSLKSNQWKPIENIPHAICKGGSGVVLDHTLHWILTLQRDIPLPADRILALDLRTEESKFLLLPDFHKRWTIANWALGVSMEGTLHISVCDLYGLEIWFMKEYGIKDSWTKLKLKMDGIIYDAASVLNYSGREKQLIYSNMHSLCWYDIEKKSTYKSVIFLLGASEAEKHLIFFDMDRLHMFHPMETDGTKKAMYKNMRHANFFNTVESLVSLDREDS